MKFDQLYSSSSGNLYVVTANSGKRLLIECGVSWTKLIKALNYNLTGIVGCILTHEHKDHSAAIHEVMKSGIDVYASAGTFEALEVSGRRRNKILGDRTLLRIEGFEVFSFWTSHDAKEPLGFIVRERETDEFLLFATDTSHIRQRFGYLFDIIAIECSYDKEILQARVDANDINETLARRLLTSHLEKTATANYIKKHCNLQRCREIHLLHLSGDNINKQQTREEFESMFFISTFITGARNANLSGSSRK